MTKILLVEDDKSLREIYGVRLLAEGYDIVSAGDGEEALAMAIKERPNLIVSDVMMPKISGFDMLDILRSTTETKDIKVIMMTALSSEDQRLRGEKLGADRYLVKSQVGIEDVVRTVHEVLGDMPNMNPAQQQAAPAPTPQPQPAPQPVAPPPMSAALNPAQAPQPAANSMSAPAAGPAPASSLPQPTAPFSSPIPRPNSLGDRVIQPIQTGDTSPTDLSAMIERELSGSETPAPSAPQQTPEPPAPASMPQPATPSFTPEVAPSAPTPPQPTPTENVSPPEPSTPPNLSVPERPDVASLSPQIPQVPQATPAMQSDSNPTQLPPAPTNNLSQPNMPTPPSQVTSEAPAPEQLQQPPQPPSQ